MKFSGTDKTIPEIASELGVQYAIEGSFIRQGDQLRITTQLIDGTTDEHLWAESYDQKIHDIFSLLNQTSQAIAREIEVPVLTVSQLSRAVELRITHKPQLSDLRDSGSIEQDADVVMFIHRDEKYYTEETWAEKHADPYPRGIADIIIAKNRNGPVDEFKLQFIEKTTQFRNLEIEQTRTFFERIKG